MQCFYSFKAVFVCCRAGDFKVAEKVVERQWTDVTESALVLLFLLHVNYLHL